MVGYKTLFQQIGLIGFTNILISLSGLILIPILTKNLSIEDYGLYVQITVTITLLSTLLLLGFQNTMVRFLPSLNKIEEIQESFYSIFFTVFIISIIATLAILILSKPISEVLFSSNLILVHFLALLVFLESLNALLLNYFRSFQQTKIYSIMFTSKTYSSLILTSYFVLNGFGILGVLLGLLISGFIILIVNYGLIFRKIGFKIPHFINIREYLVFGIPTIPSYLSIWIIESSDRYIISILLGLSFVGYYSPGYALGGMLGMFFAPMAFLLPPLLSKNYDLDNLKYINKILEYSTKYFLLISIPAVFGLSILSLPILIVLSTPEIAQHSYQITIFTAISVLFIGLTSIFSNVLIFKNKTKIIGTIWTLAALLNFGLTIILVHYIGLIGAATATLIGYIFIFVIITHYSLNEFKIDFEILFIIKSIIASFIMSLLIYFFNPTGILNILMVIMASAVIYFVILILLKGITLKEIKFFKNLIIK